MDYLKVNKATWNEKTNVHLASAFYDMEAFLHGANSLRDIELALLGDIKGKSILHLQCHFGQDTLSMARMGAQCTGVDFSDMAILKAKQLNKILNQSANFICSDIYSLHNIHEHQYDIVYTSYGTIGWLPDIKQWAKVVSSYLKPGGKFIFVEFHPVVWMYDNDFTKVTYNYFIDKPIVEEESGSYADASADIQTTSITWNHSIASVVQALIDEGLQIANFQEYDYSPYACFAHTKQIASQKYIIEPFGQKIPLVYSVVAEKKL
jgi:ubiquinone/menaquinone biosynthesis C-methylase UbiE